jgi:monoamine oxidase
MAQQFQSGGLAVVPPPDISATPIVVGGAMAGLLAARVLAD